MKKEIINNQKSDYNDYLKNISDYKEIYVKTIDEITYKICTSNNFENISLVYESDSDNYIYAIENINTDEIDKNSMDNFIISNGELGEISLLNSSNGSLSFISIPSQNVVFPLDNNISTTASTSEKNKNSSPIHLASGEIINSSKDFKKFIINNLNIYDVSYNDGIIHRSDGNRHSLTWVLMKNDNPVLKRAATNEIDLKINNIRNVINEKG